MEHSYYRDTRIEVDLDAIKHNITQFRQVLSTDTNILVAVKADAYGHGAVTVSQAALSAGATHLGVAFVDEGIQLREAQIGAPILVFGYVPPYAIEAALLADLTLTVYDLEHMKQIADVAEKIEKKAKIHLKVDTGMGRLGIPPKEVISFIHQIQKRESVELEGIYTHFATADDQHSDYFDLQLTQFEGILQQLKQLGIEIPLRHAANSSATLRLKQKCCNLVRIGISLYGFQDVSNPQVQLKRALSLKSSITQVKCLPGGSGVSYGKTYTTSHDEWIATIPIGYADGISRQLSNKGIALVNGTRVPVIGRVCMDQLMLRVNDAMPVSIGDEVVLIGKQENQEITADEIADQLDTIHYEVVTRLGSRIPRLYFEHGEQISTRNILHSHGKAER
ncbi:alanine racemase [Shimazuella kribbensis]|uniref:alanine racemase n=1 Tax=Shimazuella kribbensis TaxID=139808 RepID=UPI0004104E0D|nr:alanine racemase [Shimazuella kribbensis]